MKGIIFSLLQQVVTDEHGEDVWDDLLDQTGRDGIYTSLGSYPDEDLLALVGAAGARRSEEPDAVVRWFGRRAIPLLAASHPEFFDGHEGTVPFLLTLNDIIHAEVRKLYPDADVPEFGFDVVDGGVDLVYRSARQLCALAEGFVHGTADHYGEVAVVDQPECMIHGGVRCLIRCRFTRP